MGKQKASKPRGWLSSDLERAAVLTGIFAVVTAIIATLTGHAPWSDDDSSGRTAAPPPALKGNLLSSLKPCEELGAQAKELAELKKRRAVVVDGRCDPAPDAPVGSYYVAKQDHAQLAERLYNNEMRAKACLVTGDQISNQAGASSDRWVAYPFDGKTVYVPAIWTHGDESLQPCE